MVSHLPASAGGRGLPFPGRRSHGGFPHASPLVGFRHADGIREDLSQAIMAENGGDEECPTKEGEDQRGWNDS